MVHVAKTLRSVEKNHHYSYLNSGNQSGTGSEVWLGHMIGCSAFPHSCSTSSRHAPPERTKHRIVHRLAQQVIAWAKDTFKSSPRYLVEVEDSWERVIKAHIMTHLEKNSVMQQNQHGLVNRRSTLTNGLQSFYDRSKHLDHLGEKSCDVLYRVLSFYTRMATIQ